jgi:ABC-type glutathione transport system ATPase component
LNDVSLALGRAEIVALVGESGSGKSTVARVVARLTEPSAGRILLEGRDVLAEEPRRASLSYRSKVQMIFQDPFGSLNPIHTIAHHLERPLLLHGKAKTRTALEHRVHELLDSVGLSPAIEFARKYPHEASGGQRQRVAIARALAVGPSLILADEPVSMLDVSIRLGILNLMEQLKVERGVAFLYITHDIASARYVRRPHRRRRTERRAHPAPASPVHASAAVSRSRPRACAACRRFSRHRRRCRSSARADTCAAREARRSAAWVPIRAALCAGCRGVHP